VVELRNNEVVLLHLTDPTAVGVTYPKIATAKNGKGFLQEQ